MQIEIAEDPVLGVGIPELWCDGLPIVPANNYLRARRRASPATRMNKASRLRPLFAFLHAHGWSFFDVSVRRGGPKLQRFADDLAARCRPREDDEGNPQPREPDTMSYATADKILGEVYRLCRYWVQPGEAPLSDDEDADGARRRSGGDSDRTRRAARPDAFTIPVPAGEREPEAAAMLPEDVERVWAYLTVASKPLPPAVLVRHPARPPSAWPDGRRRRWEAARARYAAGLAWQRRQALLWALLVVGGFRRSEIPLLTVADLLLHDGRLWAGLRVRRAHRHLGRAKTGGRLVYLGWDGRALTAWQNWMESRAVLVDRWMRRTGRPDHGMLLVKRDGSPATRRAAAALCGVLTAHFGGFEKDGLVPNARFALHPHALRHTVASTLESWGLPVAVRSRHFGHRRGTTTLKYGRVSRARYVAQLDEYGARALAVAGLP